MTITPTAPTTTPTVAMTGLLNGFKSVTPFASGDVTLPGLNGVYLTAKDHTLSLVTTDRYTASVYRLLCGGADFTAFIPMAGVKMLVTILAATVKANKYGEPGVELARTDTTLSLVYNDQSIVTVQLGDVDSFPRRVMDLIPKEENAAPISAVAFDPALLAKFAKVVPDYRGAPMRLTFIAEKMPVRIDIGADFTGVIMPTRIN